LKTVTTMEISGELELIKGAALFRFPAQTGRDYRSCHK
jgi:hypothetical protein